MEGKRIADNTFPENKGEYSKWTDKKPYGKEYWMARAPKDGIGIGSIVTHKVIEHEDGTITVSPSIFFNKDINHLPQWHGYLEKGVWREC